MMLETRAGHPFDAALLAHYFQALVNMFFKILPMKENGEASLDVYMQSMQSEMLGAQRLVSSLEDDSLYASMLFILQSLIDHPEWSAKRVKREVFRAISLCNKMKSRLGGDAL